MCMQYVYISVYIYIPGPSNVKLGRPWSDRSLHKRPECTKSTGAVFSWGSWSFCSYELRCRYDVDTHMNWFDFIFYPNLNLKCLKLSVKFCCQTIVTFRWWSSPSIWQEISVTQLHCFFVFPTNVFSLPWAWKVQVVVWKNLRYHPAHLLMAEALASRQTQVRWHRADHRHLHRSPVLFRTKKVTSDVGSLIWGIFFRITCQIVTTLRIQDYPEISWWWEGFGSWDILRYSEVGGWMTRLNHLSFHQTWGERGHWSDSNQISCSMAAVAQGHVPNGKFWPLDPWAIYWNLSFPRKNGWLEDNYRFFFLFGKLMASYAPRFTWNWWFFNMF